MQLYIDLWRHSATKLMKKTFYPHENFLRTTLGADINFVGKRALI